MGFTAGQRRAEWGSGRTNRFLAQKSGTASVLEELAYQKGRQECKLQCDKCFNKDVSKGQEELSGQEMKSAGEGVNVCEGGGGGWFLGRGFSNDDQASWRK